MNEVRLDKRHRTGRRWIHPFRYRPVAEHWFLLLCVGTHAFPALSTLFVLVVDPSIASSADLRFYSMFAGLLWQAAPLLLTTWVAIEAGRRKLKFLPAWWLPDVAWGNLLPVLTRRPTRPGGKIQHEQSIRDATRVCRGIWFLLPFAWALLPSAAHDVLFIITLSLLVGDGVRIAFVVTEVASDLARDRAAQLRAVTYRAAA